MNSYRNIKQNLFIRALSICLIFLFFAGCSSAGSGYKKTEPMNRELTFAMVTKEKDNKYMQKMFDGFERGCAELGITAVLKGPESYTANAQIVCIKQAIEEKVDAILIAANHTDDLEEDLKMAMDAGIVVISLDSSVNKDSRMVHIQQADPEKVGRVLIQAAHAMVSGKGKAYIISSTPDATNQKLWVQWMYTELEKNPEKYTDFTVIDIAYCGDDTDITKEKTNELLDTYPDLDIIITPTAVSMKAVGEVIGVRGSHTLFTGLGLPSEIAQYIDSSCPWMYLWNPIDLGYLAAYTAKAAVYGDITGAVGESFFAGELGYRSIQLSPDDDGGTEIVLGNPLKFDKDNIEMWKNAF